MSARLKAAEGRSAMSWSEVSNQAPAVAPSVHEGGEAPAAAPRGGVLSIPAFYTGMRSCLFCGKHRLTSQMKAKRLLGRTQWVCSPSCGTGAR
jgi:hypothetical protein